MPNRPPSVAVGGLAVESGTGHEHLLLIMHRSSATGDGERTYSESHVKVLPTPDKVLSFEMPPIRVADQQLTDRMSLRVRVHPR